ncbi:MAG: hypothetical protein AB7K24_21395 [Gemmataceae bacterium]
MVDLYWLFLWLSCLSFCFGAPLTIVGLILCLCEASWRKPSGSMGGPWLTFLGLMLSTPVLFVCLMWLLKG